MPFFSGNFQNRQVLVQVLISHPSDDSEPEPLIGNPYTALIDTGAMGTCISPKVVNDLQLTPQGKKAVHTPTHKTDMNVYHVGFHIPITKQDGDDRIVDIHSYHDMEVMELIQPPNYDVLLGMDVLAECSLFIAGNTFTLGY